MCVSRKSLAWKFVALIVIALVAGCITTKPPGKISCNAPDSLVEGRCVPPPPPVVVSAPAPSPAPAPAPAPVPTAQKVSYSADVFFGPGKVLIRPEGKANLNDLAAQLRGMELEVIIVVGHADNGGTGAYALALSKQRAEAVKLYLQSKGIEANRIYTEGKGNSQPVASNSTAAGRNKNNRAEIEVVGTRTNDERLAADPSKWVRNRLVPVLFATNRKPTGSATPAYFYGNEMHEKDGAVHLQRGITYVRIPPRHEAGKVEGPGWIVTIVRASPLSSVLREFSDPKPEREFMFEHKIELLNQNGFADRLRTAIKGSKGQAAVLYVHGFANDFTDAAFRTAQISFDLADRDFEIVPMMFSWPSDPGLGGILYPVAQQRTDSAATSLAIFLKEIAETTKLGTVHIIAHSMGASVLVQAMGKLASPQFGGKTLWQLNPHFRQIVFAAADVTPKIFKTVIQPAVRNRHTVTNYISNKDKAIIASNIFHRSEVMGNYFRDERSVQCVDTVDVSAVAARGLAHSTWAESDRILADLRMILSHGTDPAKRGLRKRGKTQRTVWLVDRKVPAAGAGVPGPAALVPCESVN